MTTTKLNKKLLFHSDTIKLVYWNEPNFGDILSPYIVSSLTGKRIVYKSGYNGFFNCVKCVVKYLLLFKLKKIQSILFPWEKNLLCIGSILSLGNKHSIIWGSGFLSNKKNFNGGKIYAVRGKLTNNKLKNMGYEGTTTFGDPAMLISLLVEPSKFKSTEIAIIPHWTETDYFLKIYGKTYKIIDLRTRDIKRVILEITSCHYILSTSLHGIIVSHAYGIPALWIKLHTLHDDDFKFYDYFTSVDIDNYKGFTNIDEILSSEQNYKLLFRQNENNSLPQKSIHDIQQALLHAAPFKIVSKYEFLDANLIK